MAKEAIETVEAAERQAAELIIKSQQNATDMITKAADIAEEKLKQHKIAELQKTKNSLESVGQELAGEFEAYKKNVSDKCDKLREDILKDSEKIISRIIDAVREG